MITLVIFADPICPWSYIGKARLDRALEARPEHPFRIEWHPFLLHPDMPPEGMERRAHLEAIHGGREAVLEAWLPVSEAAGQSGLALDLAAIARTPSTLDAHRLLHWAHLEGRQSPVISALFRAFFAEGRDIGDAATLSEIAAGAGMDGALVARLLATDADRDDIRARDADARAKGVRSTPTYVLGNQYVIAGAQEADFWTGVIDELAATGAPDETA